MVFIKELEKEIFPGYITPEQEELFSSWFCRLSYNHNVKTNTFINNYFGRNFPFWTRDIDVSPPDPVLSIIEKHTPLNSDQVSKLFLQKYEGYAFLKHRSTGSIMNVLPLGINHRKRKQFGQQCCTNCLSKGVPYYRKSWRLLTTVVCTECKQLLIDRCFVCGSPITFFRVNIKTNSNISILDFQPIYLCSNCNTDLRTYQPARKPTELELSYQRFIDESIKKGYNHLTGYSFTFIRVLLSLALRLRSSSSNNRFRETALQYYNIPKSFIDKEIRYWSINERRETLSLVYSMFHDYPVSLSKILSEGKVMKAYLVKDNDYVPFWFEKLLVY